jgi:hypothetical protein
MRMAAAREVANWTCAQASHDDRRGDAIMNARALIVGLTLTLAGCATAPSVQLAGESPRERMSHEPGAEQSLFAGDALLLTDADIVRILAHQYRPSTPAKVTVMGLGQQFRFGYSVELARSAQEMCSSVLRTRAFCIVEAVVLDVRTGIVPFTAAAF